MYFTEICLNNDCWDMRVVEIEEVNFSFFQTWEELDKVIKDIQTESLAQMIFACDSRSLLESRSNNELKNAYENARIILPDGKPIYWCGRSDNEIHVTGPKLMDYMLSSYTHQNRRHFFVGGPEQTVKDIHNYSVNLGVNVVGSYCPPFSNIDQYNWEEIAQDINEASPDFIWIGLGAPKQELFAVKLI